MINYTPKLSFNRHNMTTAEATAAQNEWRRRPEGVVLRSHEKARERTLQPRSHRCGNGGAGSWFGKEPPAPRAEFLAWALSNERFWELYFDWVASGFQRRERPTIDRVDADKGYSFDNIRWVKLRENSRGYTDEEAKFRVAA